MTREELLKYVKTEQAKLDADIKKRKEADEQQDKQLDEQFKNMQKQINELKVEMDELKNRMK
ncbi:MAG TPA: hypothetical protein DIW15_00210 [Bavariicoccus seileri]|uniref:Uncharacterized protein n=1 Tax=Bavariicoccus seileri TaxID=549685 RepID=A0A3D4S3F3_9ENTE|nr:hypothetical protein [Bavariicoccus seileri]HCS93118.1 hypothetical protein [Bavariicoccus seileri]